MPREHIIFRETQGQVSQSGKTAVIQVNGALVPALRGNNETYFLGDRGVGVQPLVMLGSALDISAFLLANRTNLIRNTSEELEGIFMTVGPYKPGARMEGLFPVGDAVEAIASFLTNLLPGRPVADAISAFGDAKEGLEKSKQFRTVWPKADKSSPKTQGAGKKVAGGELYVRISNIGLPSDRIGIREVQFSFIHAVLRRTLHCA